MSASVETESIESKDDPPEMNVETPNNTNKPSERQPRSRTSRWEEGGTTSFAQGMPTMMNPNFSFAEVEALFVRFRLEEIRGILASLQNGTYQFRVKRNRSVSPEPTYDSTGRRTNTRDNRMKNKLIKEQQELIQRAIQMNPSFKPPPGLINPIRVKRTKKIFIPVKKFPNYNFIGQILGPRGLTQKQLEKDIGAKIVIRGKGSVLNGKERKKGQEDEDEEDLHVLIICDNEDQMEKASERIEKLLVPVPDVKNEHKQKQLELLAKLNGTYVGGREFDITKRKEKENIVCHFCYQPSHPTFDCPIRKKHKSNLTLEDEYSNFIDEIKGIQTNDMDDGENHSSSPSSSKTGAPETSNQQNTNQTANNNNQNHNNGPNPMIHHPHHPHHPHHVQPQHPHPHLHAHGMPHLRSMERPFPLPVYLPGFPPQNSPNPLLPHVPFPGMYHPGLPMNINTNPQTASTPSSPPPPSSPPLPPSSPSSSSTLTSTPSVPLPQTNTPGHQQMPLPPRHMIPPPYSPYPPQQPPFLGSPFLNQKGLRPGILARPPLMPTPNIQPNFPYPPPPAPFILPQPGNRNFNAPYYFPQ